MATHQLLSPAARAQLSAFPELSDRDLIRHYTLSNDDLSLVMRHRGDENRLGFAVQLCHLRFPGWLWKPNGNLPQTVLAYIAGQLEIDAAVLGDYAKTRDATRREHLREITLACGFKAFDEAARTELAERLRPVALATDSGLQLVGELFDAMRECKIIIPTLATAESFAWKLRQQARLEAV